MSAGVSGNTVIFLIPVSINPSWFLSIDKMNFPLSFSKAAALFMAVCFFSICKKVKEEYIHRKKEKYQALENCRNATSRWTTQIGFLSLGLWFSWYRLYLPLVFKTFVTAPHHFAARLVFLFCQIFSFIVSITRSLSVRRYSSVRG